MEYVENQGRSFMVSDVLRLFSGRVFGCSSRSCGSAETGMQAIYSTLWLFNIAVENGPFTDDFPIKTSICNGFAIAMLNNLMVYYIYIDMA